MIKKVRTRAPPHFFTHEIPLKYAKTALQNGQLISTAVLFPDTPDKENNTRPCGPVLFTRVVTSDLQYSLNTGSDGSSAAVMFVFKSSTADTMDKTTDKTNISVFVEAYNKKQTKEDKKIKDERIGKICYSANADVGGKGGIGDKIKTKDLYVAFDTSDKAYEMIENYNESKTTIGFKNEQAWGVGITIQNNVEYIILKVLDVSETYGKDNKNIRICIKFFNGSGVKKIEFAEGIDEKIQAGNSYLIGGYLFGTTKDDKKKIGGTDGAACTWMSSSADNSVGVWVSDEIKDFIQATGNLASKIRFMKATDARSKIMSIDAR